MRLRPRYVAATLMMTLSLLAGASASAAQSAALTARAAALRTELRGRFTVIAEPPFVVIGDEPAAAVRERCRSTVRWAVARLKQDYFTREPEEIIEIWLFRDRASYERHLRERFDEAPVSPYGFFSHGHGALFMNISTGSGTLVHEIVHPFLRADFPTCPAWFNEGLASLYEQCAEEDGHIVGRVNWRLPGLQERIRAGSVPTFFHLTGLSNAAFYGKPDGYSVHYGQARYLCYYLQERGLLRKFYTEFRASADNDPTGYSTLQRILGADDMAAFQRDWEAFVLRRRFAE